MFGVSRDRLLSVPQIDLSARADRKMVIFYGENSSNTLTSEKWSACITPSPTTLRLSPGEYLQTTPHLVIFVSPHMHSHIAKFYSCNSPV